jgi:lipoate---protein ligase
MRCLSLTLPDAASNLALDEALLLQAETGRSGEVLRLWEAPKPVVVLGSGCRLSADVKVATCQAEGVPVLRRASGGGTVLLGRGCLCFSLVLAYERSPALREVRSSYAFILQRIKMALDGLGPAFEQAGTSDLTVAGEHKISGNAQQRKRTYLLHHGTVLYDFDLTLVGRYLLMPSRQPGYRGQREHDAFLTNLAADPAELRRRLRAAWEADADSAAWPRDLVSQLVSDKYSQAEWVNRC